MEREEPEHIKQLRAQFNAIGEQLRAYHDSIDRERYAGLLGKSFRRQRDAPGDTEISCARVTHVDRAVVVYKSFTAKCDDIYLRVVESNAAESFLRDWQEIPASEFDAAWTELCERAMRFHRREDQQQ